MNSVFFVNSIALGIGLAMDAFSVSLANGLHECKMTKKKLVLIAFTFAFFQALMPIIGWVCVHTIINYFKALEKLIPYIALALLSYIGISMFLEKEEEDEHEGIADHSHAQRAGTAARADRRASRADGRAAGNPRGGLAVGGRHRADGAAAGLPGRGYRARVV